MRCFWARRAKLAARRHRRRANERRKEEQHRQWRHNCKVAHLCSMVGRACVLSWQSACMSVVVVSRKPLECCKPAAGKRASGSGYSWGGVNLERAWVNSQNSRCPTRNSQEGQTMADRIEEIAENVATNGIAVALFWNENLKIHTSPSPFILITEKDQFISYLSISNQSFYYCITYLPIGTHPWFKLDNNYIIL